MKIKNKLFDFLPNRVKQYYRFKNSVEYSIIKNSDNHFEELCQVKPETWDKAYYPPLYGHTKEKYMDILTPSQYAILIPNASINADSDVVITSDGVYWDKYNEEEFMTFAMPSDCNLIHYTNDSVWLKPTINKEYIKGTSLSLLGVWSYHWCHFFLQFASKLFYAGENGLLNQEVTVIVNERADANIIQLVNDYLKSFPSAKMVMAKRNTEIICENVICIPTAFPNFNVGRFRLDYPYIIPQHSIDRISKYAVDPYIKETKGKPARFEKIFLTRKSSSNSARNLTNYDEIHDYFKSLGFVDIEGAGMDLYEKADVFYHAKEIVGPHGASWQNLMFCNGARCLVFTNYRFVDDTCGYTQVRDKIHSWLNVAGQDENDQYHSNYYIPLEKIKKAYMALLSE